MVMMMIISNGIIVFGGLMIIRGKVDDSISFGLDCGAHDHSNDADENHGYHEHKYDYHRGPT